LHAGPDVGIAILLTPSFSTQSEPRRPAFVRVRSDIPQRTGDSMNSIRKFAYAALLALSTLNFAPTLVFGQEAAGTFTLSHEVHWQKAIVPAGKYRFTIGSSGQAGIVALQSLDDKGPNFVVLITRMEAPRASDRSQLFVVSRADGRFVSALQLPEFGTTLHFAVPPETGEVAQTSAVPVAISSR
jgi:hypothetical protein